MQVSKVLWELVLEAARRDEISRSYAAEVLGISPMEVQDILYELEAIRVGGQS
jgi:predicted HTH domain antitoxin